MRYRALAAAAIAALLAAGCRLEVFSTPKRPARDGYRAVFVAEDGKKLPIAVRPGRRRIETGAVVRILDLRANRTTFLRDDRKVFFEDATRPEDAVAPGYELDAPFDAGRTFPGRETLEIGDDVQAGHVCSLFRIWTSQTECLVCWVAKDLDRLLVRIQWQRLVAGELQDVKIEELVGVRPGADEKLFRAPEGYRRAASREEVLK